ncbi:site-specific integrase [Nocardia bovistercoris]|uniref:hypothetical protein n=1 Tax=Nocardia bovistercoris TaxID=2785916 RepID=UPI001E55ED0D|nr:hypothetical protein [Nocardia bovistercoris]
MNYVRRRENLHPRPKLHRQQRASRGCFPTSTARIRGRDCSTAPTKPLPDTGLARLSYDQARDLLDVATATEGPGTGWDLHELRHSGLTHLGESGASLLELMAKSRHRKPENLRRYFKPSPQAMRDLTSLLGPRADRHR